MIKIKENKIKNLRKKLSNKNLSIGSWIQIPCCETAEIMSDSKYDWIVIDMEHGSIDVSLLPNLIRSIEIGGSIPLVRIQEVNSHNCKSALDAGAYGLILPMIKSSNDILNAIKYSCWPPKGKRGVGYSRANMYGKYFSDYKYISQKPILVAQIENSEAVSDIENILKIKDLDAIMIGPYDLASTIGKKISFNSKVFSKTINNILKKSKQNNVPCGIHVVKPDQNILKKYIKQGYNFIAYSTDAYFLINGSENPMERL